MSQYGAAMELYQQGKREGLGGKHISVQSQIPPGPTGREHGTMRREAGD
jgi:hypothetical protein